MLVRAPRGPANKIRRATFGLARRFLFGVQILPLWGRWPAESGTVGQAWPRSPTTSLHSAPPPKGEELGASHQPPLATVGLLANDTSFEKIHESAIALTTAAAATQA